MITHFKMFALYNQWANRKLYDAAGLLSEEHYHQDCGAFFGTMHKTLNHILLGDSVWMSRFTDTPSSVTSLDAVLFDSFPTLSKARTDFDEHIIEYTSSLTQEKLDGQFSYTPVSDPVKVTQFLAPALAHMFNHQTHHRGQVHAMLGAAGAPMYTTDIPFMPSSIKPE